MSGMLPSENIWREWRDPDQDRPDVVAERFKSDQGALERAEQAEADGDAGLAQVLRRIIGD